MARTTFNVIFEPRPVQTTIPGLILDEDTLIATNDARQLDSLTTWLDERGQAYSIMLFGGSIEFSTSRQENGVVTLLSLMTETGRTVRPVANPGHCGEPPTSWEIILVGEDGEPDQALGQVELAENGTYIAAAWLDDDGARSVQVPQLGSLVDATRVVYAVRHEG